MLDVVIAKNAGTDNLSRGNRLKIKFFNLNFSMLLHKLRNNTGETSHNFVQVNR